MQLRDVMRPRHIDDTKPYLVIKDIKDTSNGEDKKELEKIEMELKKVIEQFDKDKKKIKILNPLLLENNNNINNEKNEKLNSNKKKNFQNNNNQDIFPKYTLQPYKRPDNYIIYSAKEKKETQPKDYEAKNADFIFLKYFNIDKRVLDIEKLEDIFSSLENTIGKSEKIPDEMAKKIVEEKLTKIDDKDKERLVTIIVNHFNDRRKELKKSLLRKFWRSQKSTDKYFAMTFRKREREKMKIRKNNQKKEESFDKVKEAGDLCKLNLLSIINSMLQKETLNYCVVELDQLIFNSEFYRLQKKSIDPFYQQYTEINNKIQKIITTLKEKEIPELPVIRIQHSNSLIQSSEDKKNKQNDSSTISLTEDGENFIKKENIDGTKSLNHKRKRADILSENNGNKKPENFTINLDLLNKNRKKIENNVIKKKILVKSIRSNDVYLCINEEGDFSPFYNQTENKLYENSKFSVNKNQRKVDYFFKEFCNDNFDIDLFKEDDDISIKSKFSMTANSKKKGM